MLASLVAFTVACFTIVPATPPAAEDAVGVSSDPSSTADMGNTYELELIADPSQSASFILRPEPNCEGKFPAGAVVTIEVLDNPGWVIQKWDGAVEYVSRSIATITMDQDHIVVLYMTSVD
jgi:hypothetical protein